MGCQSCNDKMNIINANVENALKVILEQKATQGEILKGQDALLAAIEGIRTTTVVAEDNRAPPSAVLGAPASIIEEQNELASSHSLVSELRVL